MKKEYLASKELREIAIEFTLLSLGLAGVIIFYPSITIKEMLYITVILGAVYGCLLSFQLIRISKIKNIGVKELIININLLAIPYLIITYLVIHFQDFTIAILFISSALLSAGAYLLFIRWKACFS
ncbi:hypothetical protein [Candidatus Pyrohabitans sp.]